MSQRDWEEGTAERVKRATEPPKEPTLERFDAYRGLVMFGLQDWHGGAEL